jgi:hypothetical protein
VPLSSRVDRCVATPIIPAQEALSSFTRRCPTRFIRGSRLSEQARDAVLRAIIKSAPTVGNSPTGVRDLAEAYALLERQLVPNAGVTQTRT